MYSCSIACTLALTRCMVLACAATYVWATWTDRRCAASMQSTISQLLQLKIHRSSTRSRCTCTDIQYKVPGVQDTRFIYEYSITCTQPIRTVYTRYWVLVRVRIGYDNVPVLKGLQEARPKCTVKGSGKESSMTRSKEP